MTEALLEAPTEATNKRRPLDEYAIIHLSDALQFTDDEFLQLASLNRDSRLELTAEGDLIIMPPTGFETGARNFKLALRFGVWVEKDGRGVAVDSSTGFKLPNGAKRSPNIAWVLLSRLEQVSSENKKRFLPLCPDFVIELKSLTDKLEDLEAKMREYIENGAQLGWLLNPETRRVSIYRPNAEVEIIDNAASISGEPLLKDFTLDLSEIWQPKI